MVCVPKPNLSAPSAKLRSLGQRGPLENAMPWGRCGGRWEEKGLGDKLATPYPRSIPRWSRLSQLFALLFQIFWMPPQSSRPYPHIDPTSAGPDP